MRPRRILHTPLAVLLLLFCLISSFARADDFTVVPLKNTPDIAVYEVNGDYDTQLSDGSDNVIPRREITGKFYASHPDNYDFFVIFTNFDFQMPRNEAIAFYQGVKNDVQGIGIASADNTALYGSHGRLQGTIDMGNINSMVSDPLDSGFSETMGILNHELLHRWAAKVTFQRADHSISHDLLGQDGTHWSFLLDTAGSLEYGNRWVNNGNGTFTSLQGRRYFSPLDLYLMGLIPKNDVPPMLLIDNPDINQERLPEPGVTLTGTPQYVTIDDIIAAEGERIPSEADSQKTFRIGCIFLTRPGACSEADLSKIRNIVKSWPMWFSGLTNGLGKIAIDSAPLENLPENPGPDAPSFDLRTAPPELNDGVAWLINHQNDDGSWLDSLLTADRDTSTVLSSLAGFPAAEEAVTQGRSWLENADTANLDELARKIYLLSSSDSDVSNLVTELLKRQNPDGGWGSNTKYTSSPADTALALRALSTTGEAAASVVDGAIDYLLAAQNTDSGWGTRDRSSIQTTIDVITAFIPYRGQYPLEIPIQNALTWVYGRQAADGGFGNSADTVYDTAKTLIALKQLGITSSVTDQALSFLLDRQAQDGSWLSSAYQTALAVNAIRIAMRDPDLSVSTEQIVPSPQIITVLPTEINLSVKVHNTGMPDVQNAKVTLYEGAVNDAGRIGETSVSIAGQSSETIVFKATMSKGRPYHYYVIVDPDNLIHESSEQNNSALRIVYPEATYDFAVFPEDISITPAEGNIFEPLTISAKVQNNGTVDAFNVPLQLVANNGSGPIIVATQSINLPAGQSVDASFSWSPEISGAGMSLSVVLDPQNGFAENNEGNNTATVSININASTKPDLTLSFSNITSVPDPALEAGSATLKVEISNRGFSPATNVQADFYDGVPGENETMYIGSATISVIPPGESADAVLSWTHIPVSGERIITVVSDPHNAIDEIIEDNNSAFTTLRILTLPDFTVSDTALSFSPETPHEGDAVTMSATVRNTGEQPGLNVPVAFYEGSTLIKTAIVPEIPENSQATASITFDTTGKVGIIPIQVIVDPESTILEQDRGNNNAARSFGVQNSDLWLSNSFISPNGDGVKDSAEFGYRLAVPQDVTVVVVNEEQEVVRKFAGPELIGTTFVSLTWDGLDNKGRVVDDGQYRIQVLSKSGTVSASLLVTVDTNRSSLLKAFETPYLLTTKIEYLLGDNQYNWLPDDSGVVFHLAQKKPERPQYETGIYTLSPAGGEITRLVPEEWSEDADSEIGYRYISNASDCNTKTWMFNECDQVNSGFSLSTDGYTIAFILEKYNKTTHEILQQQLWAVNRYGESRTLLDSFDYLQGDSIHITDIFPSPDGAHIAYKLYDQTDDQHFFAIVGADGTGKTMFKPEWGSGFDSQHRLTWAPDGRKLVFSDAAHAVVADLAGNMREVLQIQNPTVFFDWYGSNRILVRDLNTSNWLIDSWAVDLNAPESPLLIIEKIDSPYSWYEFGGCIKNGTDYSVSKTPLLKNGDFIAGFEWKEEYLENYIVCNIDGNCQDSDIVVFWWPEPSLTPDGGKIVINDNDGPVVIFDRETRETEIFPFGYIGCDYDLREEYDLPSYYTIWPPTESDCADQSRLDAPRWNWFDNETFLAFYYGRKQDNVIAFNIENGDRTLVLKDISVDQDTYPYRPALSPGKRYLSFLSGYNRNTITYNKYTIIGSLLNLTADLRSSKTESAVNLRGIATDLNFYSWTLEYADRKTPDDWRIIAPPSENPLVNDLLSTWIPPYEGAFLVRLTVTDKAGNTAWDRETVTWGKKFCVTNIYKTGELFSPNGDGVKDTVGLNYTVNGPVHLEISVHDENGSLVKTFHQDHALAGEYSIVWDGRDESGGIVSDGYYSIRIFDYEFFFQVDSTPPDAKLEFSPISCGLSSSLSGFALDTNLKSWTVYSGDGEIPNEWHEFKFGNTALARTEQGEIILDQSGHPIPNLIQNFTSQSMPPLSFLGNTTFRIVVEDFAGNQSIVAAQSIEEILVLAGWDSSRIDLEQNEQGLCESPDLLPISFLEPGTHNLKVSETLKQPINSATVQYRMDMQWHDTEEIAGPPEGTLHLFFDTSSLDPNKIEAVRVKITDDNGIEYDSNSVVFNPPIFSATMRCVPIGSLSPAFISMTVSLPEDLKILQLQATKTVAGIPEWVNFEEVNLFEGVSVLVAAPFPASLPEGYEYPLRFIGIGESGKVYISNELKTPPQQCPENEYPPPDKPGGVTKLVVSYSSEKAPCNSVNFGTATIVLHYYPNDELKTLPDKINYYLEENGKFRLLKQFDPAIDGWGSVTLETGNLSEGEHQVRVDLVHGEAVTEGFRQNTLLVDRTLPQARITYPALSAPFCARTVVNEQGDVFRYANIEGVAADANNLQGYSILYGKGSAPNEWFSAYSNTDQKHGQLGTWDVSDLELTEYSLKLMVTDKFGNTSCFITQANVDKAMVLSAGVDQSIFSPNGDGIKDRVSVAYQVGEFAVLNITVLHNNSVVHSLVSALEIAAGSGSISWNGLDDTGAIVPDGEYIIQVEAKDSCGNQQQKTFSVTVDNTPPTTMISFPGTGEPLKIITEIKGTANDTHLINYQLLAKDEASPDEPILLNEGDMVVENDVLGTWNTFDLEGDWTLILNAEDLVGNTKTTRLPISFGARPRLISSLQADPNIFSPNNDGKLNTTTITYELTDTANITIAIEDILGNTILSDSKPNALSGTHQYEWAGLNAGGNTVADGSYHLKITAESITPPFVVQMEEITLVTDTSPPAINVESPLDSFYYSSTVDVQGSLNDQNLNEYSVALSGGQDTLLFDTAVVNGEIIFSKSLDLPDGVYILRVDAKDAVENTNSQAVAFTVDKTRPRITLESPGEGTFFGSSLPVVFIKGIIKETNLQSYRVQYEADANPTQWVDLASGENQPLDNLMATWTVGPEQGIADGDYTVRVTAIDKAGWESAALVEIHVDSHPPKLAVTNPAEGSSVREPFDIIGTVTDPNLKEYTLKMADSACGDAVNWSTLRTSVESVQNGTIAPIQMLPPDGVYCIRLAASDTLDNDSEKEVGFTVDTTPPDAPVLSGNLEHTGVSLRWQGNIEPDLAGYNLFRNNEKINTVLLNATEFTDQDLEKGEYTYMVRAVDSAGWESGDSNQVVFTVDLAPPEAMISSPRDGFLLSNYVDITGRAYSADDFKEYQVSYGIGENPNTWELLRKSPVPVSYGVLVRWDLIPLEDGPYTIKLTAEDLNGNVKEKVVTVTVDNTPPAAPVLLTATPSGANVDLTWQADTESDPAGYLVFRDGQLANVSGTVVGDLKPYLITELSFQNVDVPDGTHDYYLVAMDNAGNMSDQSNTIQVSLDTHAPHLTIISPVSGLEFDKTIPVKADSEDIDIATVRFQYQRNGESAWSDMGAVLTQRPYVVNLDPTALGWEYGSYHLRAVATDQGGLFDETPEEVEIQYKDISPPAAPTDTTALVNGGFVTLSWSQSQEPDFAGYNVYLGTGNQKRNTVLLTDVSFIDPTDFADGNYAFAITAVDSSGNESEKTPVTATVFTPILNQPPTPVNVPDITVDGNTVPGATVEIFRTLTTGTESLGTTPADAKGLFTLAIALTEGDNSLYAVTTDSDGNISQPSSPISVVYDLPPSAPTGLAGEVIDYDISLSWNPNTEPDLAGYNIYRKTTAGRKKINTSPVAATVYTDSGLKNDTYSYTVTAVNNAGVESTPSNESTVEITQPRPAPPSNLAAEAVPEGRAIELCWNPSTEPVEGYRIYRALISEGPYAPVNNGLPESACYHDSGLTNGTEYFYVVRAVDSLGNESMGSNEASAIPQDTVTPDKPLLLLPTSSGRPYQSPAERIDVGGFTEAGATVDLIHDQEWIDTVESLNEPVHESYFLTDFETYETVATPDGKTVFYLRRVDTSIPYRYDYYTFRKNLETGVEIRIDQIPEGSWEHKMSPDGTMIVYNFDDDAGRVKIGVYEIATGMATILNTGMEVDDWEPSWSGDGTKIVFDSDRGNGFYDMWMYDLPSGETSRITEDFGGYYPEVSADGQKMTFASWDSANNTMSLYLVDTTGGSPVLLYADVDWSGYYPSVEWSPQGNKLAYTANHDGRYDMYVLDADTGETSRLTNTENTEIYPQWSPDGKYISYYSYGNGGIEVRMVSTNEQAENFLLYSFAGSIYMNFNWLPSGIFYKVDSDLHQIIPPGEFIFKDVGLHSGENIFTATAEDAAGHVSDPADEILVNVDADVMPDLEVLDRDIFILPGVPLAGEETTFSIVVGNRSPVAAENVRAEIYIQDAENNISLIHSETIAYFGPYSEEWLSVDWDSAGMTGTNTVYVFLDPDNEIAESLEENNFSSKSFYVADEAGVIMETTLNGAEFRSDELVSIDVDLHNSGPEKDVHLAVTVEDENGVPVEHLADLDKNLAYGGNDQVALSWRAGSAPAGTYQVRAVLLDASAGPIDEQVVSFAVLPDIDVSAAVTTNKVKYGPDKNVMFGLSVANQGSNMILPALNVKLTIADSNAVLHVEEQTLVNLSPGDGADLNMSWNTGRQTPGDYTAALEVSMDGNPVAAGSTKFSIIPVMNLSGTITATPKVVFRDGSVEAEFSISGSGNVEPGETTIQILVQDTRDRTTVASHEETMNLGLDETVGGRHVFTGVAWNMGVYQMLLQSIRENVARGLASDSFTVRDGVAPIITVFSPVDGAVFNDAVALSITAVDDASGVAGTEYRLDDATWLPLPLIDPATGRYAASLPPVEADEGPHTVEFRASDHSGNVSVPTARAIVIRPRVDMTTTVDKASCAMNEEIAVSMELVNTAWSKHLHLITQIETADGVVLSRIIDQDLVLDADERRTMNTVWNTGTIDAGMYNVRATVMKNGTVLTENMVPFEIEKTLVLHGALSLSAISVPSGDTVRGDWTVTNNGNFNITGLTVENLLTNQASAGLQTWTETIALNKGQTVSGSFQVQTGSLAVDSYLVTLKARYESEEFDLAAAQFDVIDSTPPVISILSPAAGALVNGPIKVAALATDDAAGVDIVEYRVDERDWQPLPLTDPAQNRYSALWTPVETDEGPRTISVRGRDKAGNISDPVSAGVTVELCKPFESLSGTLNISPVPLYYSQDASLEYTLVNQCNKPLDGLNIRAVLLDHATGDVVAEKVTTETIAPKASATGRFVISTLDLNVQQYHVLLEIDQTDTAPRVVAESSFEVLAALEVDNKPLDRTDLLVWLNNGQGDDDEYDGDHYQDEDGDDDEKPPQLQKVCGQGCSSYEQLKAVFAQAAASAMIVCNRDDFENELRNPMYSDIVIIGDHQQLTDHHDEELREHVYSGTGLISFAWNVPGDQVDDDDDNGNTDHNESFLGVTAKGTLSESDHLITLEDSPVSNAGELEINGKLVRIESGDDTVVAGWVMGEKDNEDDGDHQSKKKSQNSAGKRKKSETERYPALVLHEYGLGRTVYAAFGLCETFNDQNNARLTDLLMQALGYVHRQDDGPDLIPLQTRPFAFDVTSPGLNLDVTVNAVCPEDIVLFDPIVNHWVEQYPWTMTVPIQAGETAALPYYILAPDREGRFPCEFDTGFVVGSQYTALRHFTSEFIVTKDRMRRLEEALTAIDDLEVTGREKAKKKNARKFVENVLDRTELNRKNSEKNIHDIEKAINSLLFIESSDTGNIRLQLDTLLRIEQGWCYLYE